MGKLPPKYALAPGSVAKRGITDDCYCLLQNCSPKNFSMSSDFIIFFIFSPQIKSVLINWKISSHI